VDGVTKLGKLAFSSREERQARELPQDAGGDGARPARLMIKLATACTNMAHARVPRVGQGAQDRPGNARHLRAARASARHGQGQGGARGSRAADAVAPTPTSICRSAWPSAASSARRTSTRFIAIIERKLSEVGIESQIRGRPKHFYSIFKKMHDQGREFDENLRPHGRARDHQFGARLLRARSA